MDSKIRAAGWSNAYNDESGGDVAYYESNPTEPTSQPIETYHLAGKSNSTNFLELNLNLITTSVSNFWPDSSNFNFYTSLTNKYLTNGKFIYGYEIDEQYATGKCYFCSAKNP